MANKEDSDNKFQEIRSKYKNESYSAAKIKLIELIKSKYQKEGILFLQSQYKNNTSTNYAN